MAAKPDSTPWQDCVPSALREQIERSIEASERVEWVGLPAPKYYSTNVRGSLIASVLALAFGVGWFAKVIFGSQAPPPGTAPFCAALCFGLFVFAVAVLLALSPLQEYRKWLRRAYIVTDRRMIAFDGRKAATLRRFEIEPVGDLVRIENRDGTCDLLVEGGVSTEDDAWSQNEPLGFQRIRDAGEVEALLSRLSSCHSPIPTVEHPTHDRPFVVTLRVGVALCFVTVFPLVFTGHPALGVGLFFGIVLAAIMFGFARVRSCVCPRCGARLARDPESPRGTYLRQLSGALEVAGYDDMSMAGPAHDCPSARARRIRRAIKVRPVLRYGPSSCRRHTSRRSARRRG